MLDGVEWQIDETKSLQFQAVTGLCEFSALPNDTYAIYGTPSNYTLTVSCEHVIKTDYMIKLTFPESYWIYNDSNCEVGDFDGKFE